MGAIDRDYFGRMDRDQLLHRLANQRLHVADCQRALDRSREAENEIRNALVEKMGEEGIRTVEGYGLQVVMQRREKVEVTDQAAIRNHLIALGLLDQYTRLDLVPIKKHAIANGWPGVSRETVDTLVVRDIKTGGDVESTEGA